MDILRQLWILSIASGLSARKCFTKGAPKRFLFSSAAIAIISFLSRQGVA